MVLILALMCVDEVTDVVLFQYVKGYFDEITEDKGGALNFRRMPPLSGGFNFCTSRAGDEVP